ncbi:MAG: hypothetical protein H6718_36965 [Polyangiaceae bacterium]|nr:hypothetical protein [Polyangiaceae bacterium]
MSTWSQGVWLRAKAAQFSGVLQRRKRDVQRLPGALALQIATAWLIAATAGCASEVPRPAHTAHAWSDFQEVNSPPPVPRPEEVGEAPTDEAVWVDGYWVSRGGIWTWRDGGWVHAPAGSRLAEWKIVYDRRGRMLYAPSSWRDVHGQVMDPPAFLDEKHQKRQQRRAKRRAKRREKRLRQRELMNPTSAP